MTRMDIINALAEYYEIEANEDGGYDMDDYEWESGCNFDGKWLSLATIVKILTPLTEREKMQFEAGSGVNFIRGNGYYAEIEIPEGASEDYGYLTMKAALIDKYPETAGFEWWYDGQEDRLEADAAAAGKVYTDKE